MYFPLFVVILCLSLFWYALLCVFSSFAIILKRKRELVALLLLSYGCLPTVNVLWLFLTVLWVSLQCVIVVFLDHTHLLFDVMTLVFVLCCWQQNKSKLYKDLVTFRNYQFYSNVWDKGAMCINNKNQIDFLTKLKFKNTAIDFVTWYKVHFSQRNSFAGHL